MSQSSARKRKLIDEPSAAAPSSSANDLATVNVIAASSDTSSTPLTNTHKADKCAKGQREHRTPINYLDVLPKDVLSHLFFYLKLFTDEDMYSLGKVSRSMLTSIQKRYERSVLMKWHLYRLSDIEANQLKCPLTTHEERTRYVLISHNTPHNQVQLHGGDNKGVSASSSNEPTKENLQEEWVILRHTIDMAIFLGLESLPFESFALNEYQPNRFAIGQITRLNLVCWSQTSTFIKLAHLKFLPSTSLRQVELTDVLHHSSEQVIETYVWPQRLQNISLNGFHSSVLTREMISRWPPVLKQLSLGPGVMGYEYRYDLPSSAIFIPPSVEHLYLDGEFLVDPFLLQLPPGLLELTCTPRAMTSLGGKRLPDSLKTLHLGDSFIDSVDGWILPPGLETLTFHSAFNESLNGMIFNQTLTHLLVGGCNRSLVGITFPASLIHLEFGPYFEQSLLGLNLPQGLKTLIYGDYLDPSIFHPQFSLPPSITHLHLGKYKLVDDNGSTLTDSSVSTHHRRPIQLPPNLRYLQIPVFMLSKDSRLPVTIEELVITFNMQWMHDYDYSHLNETLGQLTVLRDFELDCGSVSVKKLILPPSLEQFTLTDPLLEPFVDTVVMGPKLKRLIFGQRFNDSLNRVKFPDSIEFIQFMAYFNRPIDKVVFPASLREIQFGSSFNQSLDGVNFPIGLEVLNLKDARQFNQSLVHCRLPTSLKRIQLSSAYNCSLVGCILPSNLERFEMGHYATKKEQLKKETSPFMHLDSLIELQFPSTIQFIRLTNPQRYLLPHYKHPYLDRYKEWLAHLSRLYPYARIQFNRYD